MHQSRADYSRHGPGMFSRSIKVARLLVKNLSITLIRDLFLPSRAYSLCPPWRPISTQPSPTTRAVTATVPVCACKEKWLHRVNFEQKYREQKTTGVQEIEARGQWSSVSQFYRPAFDQRINFINGFSSSLTNGFC
ncbi:hypothetical protein RRG08_008476 [Elysia crispata]|uniref:Uncharacterized protein n=1 Tax=Elysia crispata TaxID=231223 RepID=A0AAE1DBP2_9GAST|nr:hypothetical protein RRG08_008476 [Elysia crispata]